MTLNRFFLESRNDDFLALKLVSITNETKKNLLYITLLFIVSLIFDTS